MTEAKSDMPQRFTVRRLRQADRDAWQPLWDQYLRFYRSDLAPSTSDTTFTRLCEEGSSMLGLLAIDREGAALGLAHLIFHPSTWAVGPYCYLEDLFVDHRARGSGLGPQLFDVIYEIAREHGADRVYWHTQQYNSAARSLYDTVGHLTSFIVYEHEL